MKAAIWAAVSTQAQAKQDKVSIDVQLQRARQLIQTRAWHESAGPYIAIASRTRWVDLKDAAQSIPDLALLLTDARARAFDVLVIFDYTRLRALLEPLAKTLNAYGIQILSVSQPIEITLPSQYDPSNADGAAITEFTASFMSKAEIAALKRRFKIGMPSRVIKKGLPKGTIPYGYRKPIGHETDRQAVPERDPVTSAAVIQIKDLFLSGQSLWQIADQLTAEHKIKPRGGTQWSDVTVRLLLKNKYYSGEVCYGRTRRISDPITGLVSTINNPASAVQTAKGAHIPLWDEATQEAIEAEFSRRGKKYTGITTQRLSNLLYCGMCHSRMWVEYPGGYAKERKRQWSCRLDHAHIRIKDSDLLPLVIQELTSKLENMESILIPAPIDETENIMFAVVDIQTRKSRILEAYEASAITLPEFSARTEDLNSQLSRLEKKVRDQQNLASQIKRQSETLQGFAQIIKQIPDFITNAEPQRVNTHLRNIISRITVTPDQVEITFRTV